MSLDKIDHNNTVGVMYYPFVEKILAFFPNAALLYHVNNVRLNQFHGSNRYKIHDNICIVPFKYLGLLGLDLWPGALWWPKVYIGSA